MNRNQGRQRALATLATTLAVVIATAAFAAYPSAAAPGDLDQNNGPLVVVRGNGTELWSVWPDGAGLTRLLQGYSGLADPTWSPDSSRLAFSTTRSGRSQIYVVNADGSGAVRISDGSSADRAPAWSPSGDLIAFNRGYDVDDGFYEVWVMTPTGGSARPLIRDNTSPDTTDGVTSGRGTGTAGVPSWSPDGNSVLFSGTVTESYYDESGELQSYQECCAVFDISVSTGSLRQITDRGAYYEPSYSPDGSSIIFSTGNNAIGVMAADGSAERQVDTGWGFTVGCYPHPDGTYDPPTCDSDLTFSPEGQIAWTSTNPQGVVVQSLDGSGRRQITDSTGFAWRSTPILRIAGVDRTQTAVAASKHHFRAGGAGAVVLSRSDSFADALAGTALAVAKKAPLLLTETDRLSDATAIELKRVLTSGKTVYLLGGTAALSPDVEASVRNLGFATSRLAGTDRFETAVKVATHGLGSPSTVFLASGLTHSEALVAGVTAAKLGGTVLLTADGTMPARTRTYLEAYPNSTVYAVGAARGTYPAHSISGATPAETAVALARRFFTDPPRVAIASNTTFPDALSGGAHAGHAGIPLLLAGDTTSSTNDYVREINPRGAFMYGGTAAIGRDAETSLENAIHG